MLILLPPSETKRSGGAQRPIDLDALALPALRAQRDTVIDALVALSGDDERAARVLKLSVAQRGDIAANRALRTAATLPAIDRYTGVLFDALAAADLDAPARRWLGSHALIHSAPFGPVGALDRIPAYRLAAGATLPGLPPLRRVWAEAIERAWAEASPSFVLDLRSEAYSALGPLPDAVRSAYVRVVTQTDGGAVRALNHFNKRAKGLLVRALAETRPRVSSSAGFERWAGGHGWTVRAGRAGELDLVVPASL